MSNRRQMIDVDSLSGGGPVVAMGLMSGTSCDGIDAALIETDGESVIDFIAAETFPYDSGLRERLLHVAQNEATIDEVLLVERQMTWAHVDACRTLREKLALSPTVIGFHGHTIRHEPPDRGNDTCTLGMTQQIGDANLLAEQLGCLLVSDFRRRDIAAGGEGAPLVPLFHRELLHSQEKPIAVLNIGGVANITWLGPNDAILAGDTGPGCGLLDAWVLEHKGAPFDENGKLASFGKVHHELVDAFVKQPYFLRPLPKSADRFQFEVEGVRGLSTEDGAATLCAATVAAVEQTVSLLPSPPQTLYVTGGGAQNPFLFGLLTDQLGRLGCEVESVASRGLRVDSLEAECFAWLAVRRLRGLPTTLPETTGCREPICGGQLSH